MKFPRLRDRVSRLRDLTARDGGFTLIEVLAVMVIVGLLAAVAVPQISKWREKAAITSAQQDARNVVNGFTAWAIDKDVEPLTELDEGGYGDPEIQAFADLYNGGIGGNEFAEIIGAGLSDGNNLTALIPGGVDGGTDMGAYITNDKYNFALIYTSGGGMADDPFGVNDMYPVGECDNPEVVAWKQSMPKSAKKDGNTLLIKGDMVNPPAPPADMTPIC